MYGYGIKPFCKTLTVNDGEEFTGIELNDTEGNAIDCNYCRVELALAGPADGTVGYFYVRPELGYFSGTVDPSGVGPITTEAGAGCAAAGLNTGIIEIRTSKAEKFSEISIGNVTGTNCDFVITYGFEYATNSLEFKAVRNRGQ